MNKVCINEKLVSSHICQTISKFRVVETEIWDFENGGYTTIPPTLPSQYLIVGVGLYLVPDDFCRKQ